MELLTGKIALITGAGKGIGRAIAAGLAKEGVHLGLIARTEADLKKVATELEHTGVTVATAAADVSDLKAVNVAVEKIRKELGPIDILINNAGIAAFGKFMELDPADFEKIIRINLFGAYYTTRAVLPEMLERQTGDIINIASTAGQKGNALTSAYSASKFALLGLTESLMQEVRKNNIRVTALTPSTVSTNLARELNLISGDPENVMQAEDLAELIVSQLKLNRRVFVKEAGIWSTNP